MEEFGGTGPRKRKSSRVETARSFHPCMWHKGRVHYELKRKFKTGFHVTIRSPWRTRGSREKVEDVTTGIDTYTKHRRTFFPRT